MNINSEKIDDFLRELLNEQVALSMNVKNTKDERGLLKCIKDVNQVITLVYGLQKTMNDQREKANKR